VNNKEITSIVHKNIDYTLQLIQNNFSELVGHFRGTNKCNNFEESRER
jgi:hypothetical protein